MTTLAYPHVGVVGGGAWGSALASAARRAGRDVTLWAREADVAAAIVRDRRNPRYLPDVELPEGLQASSDLSAVLAGRDVILMAVPAQVARTVARDVAGRLAALGLDGRIPVLSCAKGIERDTGALPGDVLAAELPSHPLAVLSGPGFARELALGLPTAQTIASPDSALALGIAQSLASPVFRPYAGGDTVGVQVAGAVKNVYAIACGATMGMGLGENARIAVMTRGLAEMTRLAVALGARAETMLTLAGVGDLALTTGSPLSRNMSFGRAIGQGVPLSEALSSRGGVVEGVETAHAVVALAHSHGVEMPIAEAVRHVVAGEVDLATAREALLARPIGRET